jgi:hypothetical protein
MGRHAEVRLPVSIGRSDVLREESVVTRAVTRFVEHERLERAPAALDRPAGERVSASAARRREAVLGASAARGCTGRERAPRGANREAVLRAVEERPGSSPAALAAGVGRGEAHALQPAEHADHAEAARASPSYRAGNRLPPAGCDDETFAWGGGLRRRAGRREPSSERLPNALHRRRRPGRDTPQKW